MRLGERSSSSLEGHTGLCVPHLNLPQARSAAVPSYLVSLVPSTALILQHQPESLPPVRLSPLAPCPSPHKDG